jgi:hypothetical protein
MPKCHKFTNQLTAKPNNAIHQFTKTVGQSSPGDGRRWKGDTFRTVGHWGLKHGCPIKCVVENQSIKRQLPNGQKWGPSPFLGTAYGMNHAAVQQLYPLNIRNTAKHWILQNI